MTEQNTPARRRATDREESALMTKVTIVDLLCLGGIRKAVERDSREVTEDRA